MPSETVSTPIRLRLTLIALPPMTEDACGLEEAIAPYLHWLSEDELARSQRAKVAGLATRQSLVRLCLRAELGYLTGRHPASLGFNYGPQGKPSLVDSALVFNQSHSGDLLLIGSVLELGADELLLGLDIERQRANTDIDAIYRHYFSEPEQRFLEGLDDDARREAFFDLWALKESYIKATGRGLAEGLKSFGFDLAACSRVEFAGLERFYQGIELSRFGLNEPANSADMSHCWHWLSALGHIDSEFRLAYTLATPLPQQVALEFNRPTWQELLQTGASLDAPAANQIQQG